MKCKRCSFYNREPKETGKRIDGVPICSECMLQDAATNRGRVMDYSGLKEAVTATTEPQKEVKEKPASGKKPRGFSKRTKSKGV